MNEQKARPPQITGGLITRFYSALGRLVPQRELLTAPRRIVFIRPCCIGDVVMATAALRALRGAFPAAHITWAVGSWSAAAIEAHPDLDAILDTGPAAMPWDSPGGIALFLRRLRAGHFDLALSLVRSPVMSLALMLAGIPLRVGLDSDGRGFGYNLRVPVHPSEREHESAIYLRVISVVAGRAAHACANVPVQAAALESIARRLNTMNIAPPFILAHPGGGSNPGLSMQSKRYPPTQLAEMLNRVAMAKRASLILIGGPGEQALVAALAEDLNIPFLSWVNQLTLAEIAALASLSLCYIGNDSGLTHLAAAAGAATVMMMGPTDPQRYRPFTKNHLVLWKPHAISYQDLSPRKNKAWDWSRDGFAAEEGAELILEFLRESGY